MKNPKDLIYDVIVEKFHGNRPARVFIKFEQETPTRFTRNIVEIVDAIDCKPVQINPCNLVEEQERLNKIEEAIEMLVWAANNDPDPVSQKLLAFLNTLPI